MFVYSRAQVQQLRLQQQVRDLPPELAGSTSTVSKNILKLVEVCFVINFRGAKLTDPDIHFFQSKIFYGENHMWWLII